jgi:hypothetical protein
VAGDLTIRSRQNGPPAKQIPFRRCPNRPMISLIANDNWAEYTLRYVVGYKKKKNHKSVVYKNIN